MLVLDSNVWIHVATADEFPVEIYSETLGERLRLFEDFYDGDHRTVVSAYMLEEIRRNVYRSRRVSKRDADEVLTRLFELIHSCSHIELSCSRAELEQVDLRAVRQQTNVQLLADLLGIQTKDVPIFSLAYEHRYDRPHVLTDDAGFAVLSPAEFGLSNITIEELNLTWDS